jgi:hypothetical protein
MADPLSSTDNPAVECRKLYAEYRKDLLARQLSNSENFNRSILSLSSAILAVSVAFLRSQGPSPTPHYVGVLSTSWIAFALAIVSTVLSFMTSQVAIDRHLQFAARYYLEGREDAIELFSIFGRMTSWLNRFSGAALWSE